MGLLDRLFGRSTPTKTTKTAKPGVFGANDLAKRASDDAAKRARETFARTNEQTARSVAANNDATRRRNAQTAAQTTTVVNNAVKRARGW